MNHTEVIDKIFKLRKKIGIKQKDMAGMINVTGNTLSRWENKKNIPHPIALRKMERMLRFRPEQQIEKRVPDERIKEVLESMQRLRKEKNSDTGEKSK